MTSIRFGRERDDQSETVPRPRIPGSFEREKFGGMARKGAEEGHTQGQGTNTTIAHGHGWEEWPTTRQMEGAEL